MPYIADWFSDKDTGRWYTEKPGTAPVGAPAGSPPPTTGPKPAASPLPTQAGPGTGFIPLAAYFAPNREGAQKMAGDLMNKYPAGMYEAGATQVPGAKGPMTVDEAKSAGYKEHSAQTAAEAGSELSNMNPLDSFLTSQAGGQQLFDRLAQWAKPYQPPAPVVPDYGSLPFPGVPEKPKRSAQDEAYFREHGYYPEDAGKHKPGGNGIGGGGLGGGG